MNIRENAVISSLKKFAAGPFLSDKKMKEHVASLIETLKIKTPSQETKIGVLSGGNQQR